MTDRRFVATTLGLGLVLALLQWGPEFLLGLETLASHDGWTDDWTQVQRPFRQACQAALRSGGLPLWEPAMGTGYPLHAYGESGCLYPPNMALLLLLPLSLAMSWLIVGHQLLAALGAALLFRRWGSEARAAIAFGLVFAFSAFLVVRARQTPLLMAASWAPWLLWAIERCFERPTGRRFAAVAGVAACSLLAGHPQIAYYHALIGGLWTLGLAWRWRADGGGRVLAGLVGAGALAGMLAAGQLLPTAQLVASGGRSGGLDLAAASVLDVPVAGLLTYLDPGWFGHPGQGTAPPGSVAAAAGAWHGPGRLPAWELLAWVGLLPLGFAAVGLRSRRWGLVALVGLCVAMALGSSVGLARLLHSVIPGYGLFRAPGRLLLYANLGLLGLAALGATELGQRARGRWALVLVGALAIAVVEPAWRMGGHHARARSAEVWAEPATVTALGERLASGYLPFDPGPDSMIRADRAAGGWHGDRAPFLRRRELLPPNLGMRFGLRSLEAYAALTPARLDAAQQAAYVDGPAGPDANLRLLRTLGVRWVLAQDVLPPSLPEVARVGPASLHELAVVEPPARLVAGAVIATDAEAFAGLDARASGALAAVMAPGFDPRRSVVLEAGDVAPNPPGEPMDGGVTWELDEPHRTRLRVDAPADAWLVLHRLPWPEWRATVDGNSTPIRAANLAGSAIAVPAGEHVVELRYRGRPTRVGLGLGAVGLLLLVGLARRD